MDKSPDAFRTISEVAEDLDVPQHVLRFWESRFAQIKPLKRGGGRRYYRPDDVDLLRGIRHLLYGEGYTIKGVQRILKAEGLRFVQSIGRGDQRAPARPAGGAEESDDAEPVEASDPTEAPEAGLGRAASSDDGSDGPPAAPGAALAADDLACLRKALDELLECERVLKTLSAAQDSNGSEEVPA